LLLLERNTNNALVSSGLKKKRSFTWDPNSASNEALWIIKGVNYASHP
jgi:hypothetical protein